MGRAIAFDTLAYTKRLKAAGVPEKQAEVQAEALAEIVDERLATKQDLKELKLLIKQDLKELETRMTLRLGSIMAGGIVIVAALVKLL